MPDSLSLSSFPPCVPRPSPTHPRSATRQTRRRVARGRRPTSAGRARGYRRHWSQGRKAGVGQSWCWERRIRTVLGTKKIKAASVRPKRLWRHTRETRAVFESAFSNPSPHAPPACWASCVSAPAFFPRPLARQPSEANRGRRVTHKHRKKRKEPPMRTPGLRASCSGRSAAAPGTRACARRKQGLGGGATAEVATPDGSVFFFFFFFPRAAPPRTHPARLNPRVGAASDDTARRPRAEAAGAAGGADPRPGERQAPPVRVHTRPRFPSPGRPSLPLSSPQPARPPAPTPWPPPPPPPCARPRRPTRSTWSCRPAS